MEGFGEKKFTKSNKYYIFTCTRVQNILSPSKPCSLFSHHPIPISHQLSCLRMILFMMRMRGGVRVLV